MIGDAREANLTARTVNAQKQGRRRTRKRLAVVLVEDHSLVRAGLKALLRQLKVRIVGEAKTGYEALDVVGKKHPDLVLMDIVLPGLNGIEATARIRHEFPEVHVLMVTLYPNEEYVHRAMAAGAGGYLLKDADADEFAHALEVVGGGGTYLSPAIAAQLARRRRPESGPHRRLAALTLRQREVLQLIAEGHPTRDIARTLRLSVKTIETHRSQLMRKLDIHDVPGLVRFALRAGLVTLEP